jgi:hypothetical protein
MSELKPSEVRFEATQIEVGTGNGYRWAPAVLIVKSDGKLYPPVLISEARQICKREGWTIVSESAVI